MKCPYCHSANCVKNGSNSVGTKKFLCKDCRRQFVENPIQTRIPDYTKELIDKMLLEIGLTHESEATAEPKRFTVSVQANDIGIDGFLSSSFIYSDRRFFFSA